MGDTVYSRLVSLYDRLDSIFKAYEALGWLASCSDHVPSDRVGWVMMPLDATNESLLQDFRQVIDGLQEARRSPELPDC